MSVSKVFVDTNILVYAHDSSAGARRDKAKEKVLSLWELSYAPTISVQVLHEFFVNLVRKGVARKDAESTVSQYFAWDVVDNTLAVMKDAFLDMARWKISFWDALILAAAKRSGAEELWSEDLSHNQEYGGIRVVNPFR